MIESLLIANRGEIACRIIRTARRLGIRTIAVYSPADRGALHTLLADQAVPLSAVKGTEGLKFNPSVPFTAGPVSADPIPAAPDSSAAATYLNQAMLLTIAAQTGAQAIHPGYGFLSENAEFARAVENAGLIFVGPRAEAIAAMGSKAEAKRLMQSAGVPLLPGYHGADQDAQLLQTEAEKIGFPVLIKAVAGGGGRGLRVVDSATQFLSALAAVKREASSAFGDDRVLLEKYLPSARHVEVQIFADHHGNCLHLHERDCSIQRRHQKLIEEAPAPGLHAATRLAMGEAAVRAARAINYTGAGTIEFLYKDDAFYFLEMNTRLQVEHTVTEMITGLDLVEWQLRVASGAELPLQQNDVARSGWAIEARINAEHGAPDFLPSTGLIQSLTWPAGTGVRVDAGFRSGDRVSVYYDSLLGKVIAHGASRAEAIARLSNALGQIQVSGISHNAAFLGAVIDTAEFRAAEIQTGFVLDHQAAISSELLRRESHRCSPPTAEADYRDWGTLTAWRTGPTEYVRKHHLQPIYSDGVVSAACDGSALNGADNAERSQTMIKAPLPGRIISIPVRAGDSVSAGQALLIMEAMKMEHTLRATGDSVIKAVLCADGEMVQPDQILLEFAEQ